jgi:hypothetical protein
MKNTFTKNAGFDHLFKFVKSIGIALFSLIALTGFAQSGTIVLNGSSTLPVSSATKFPIWLPGGSSQSINVGSNVTSISGILYNITPSTAGGNIMTVNSVVYITGLTSIAAGTALKVEGILFTSTSGSGSATWNVGGNTSPGNPNLGAMDGTSAVSLVAGTGGLNIGTDGAAKTITIGTTSDVISENVGSSYTLNGIGASTYNIGAATVTGTITIGGTAQTGAIGICTGTGVQTLNLGTGGTGIKAINIGTGAVANPITIGNSTAGSAVSIPSIATFSNGTYSALFTGGSVGIGTATPYAPLTIAYQSSWTYPTPGSSAIGAINIHASTSPGETGITFSQAGGNNAQAGIYVHQDNSAGTHMYFATTNSYATGPQVWMTILNNGNVGIGTVTPTSTLQVNGTVSAPYIVLQTVYNAFTATTTSSTTYSYIDATGTDLSIVAKRANSIFKITVNCEGYYVGTGACNIGIKYVNTNTQILGVTGSGGDAWMGSGNSNVPSQSWNITKIAFHAPGTVVGGTYTYRVMLGLWSQGTAYINYPGYNGSSIITIEEIGQ